MMVVNGATILFRNKCRIELVSHARFLFGKQIMAVQEAETSMRRLYYKLQIAYVGPVEDRAGATDDARARLTELRQAVVGDAAITLGAVADAFEAEDFYKALKLLRMMIRDEKADTISESDRS